MALRFPIDSKTGRRTDEEPISSFVRQPPISKKQGNIVPVAFFEDPKHVGVSAVIYCHNNVLNHPEPLGSDFVLLRNPNAIVPLPDNFLKLGAEWRPENDNIIYENKNFIANSNAFDYLDED